jgi:hypothetical protein
MQGPTMKADKPKDNVVKQKPFTNSSRIKSIFAVVETELHKQFETKKV